VRFHLIDRIDELDPGRSVRGRKVTSLAEEFWEQRPDGPVMPPPLVLEALCQAATWLIVASTGHRRRAALLQIGAVSFDGDVRPGDVVDVHGEIESLTEEMAVLSGTASVAGKPVLGATDIMCALIDADELDGPEETARTLRGLTREDAR
jgi:3-hydroxyacyl-[acyl-carrier-protein] dehydratase